MVTSRSNRDGTLTLANDYVEGVPSLTEGFGRIKTTKQRKTKHQRKNMNKEELKFYLRWSYNEPKHPTKTRSKFTWETGIDMTIIGPKLKFDENTTLTQWRKSEIEKRENLMEDFKKDKKVRSLDFIIRPNEDGIKEIESDKDFIKWTRLNQNKYKDE